VAEPVSALRLAGVTKAFGDTEALCGVDLEVAEGELLAVVGPSGSGKSTLLRVVAGLEAPEAGTVEIAGRDVRRTEPSAREVGMVFQGFALFPHLSVADNIAFGMAARGVGGAERTERATEAAARLGLEGKLNRLPRELSGGERQRVALARALVRRPALLLLDEPLSNLDAPLRVSARAEIRRVQADTGVATVHVTHDQEEALLLGHRVAVMDAGRVLQASTPEELYDRPATAAVAGFVGRPPMNLMPGDGNPFATGAATVGVRPEDVLVVERGEPAVLETIERAGHDVVWRLRAGEVRFAARPPEGAVAQEGDTVRVRARRVHRFDAEGRAQPDAAAGTEEPA
jgi:ABC-type sugar transport system ATPase subunit